MCFTSGNLQIGDGDVKVLGAVEHWYCFAVDLVAGSKKAWNK